MSNATKGRQVETPVPKSQPKSEHRSRIEIYLPQKLYLAVIVALIIPYFVAAGAWLAQRRSEGHSSGSTEKFVSSNSPTLAKRPDIVIAGNPGPWGNVEYVPMFLEVPEEYLSVRADEAADRRWFFGGMKADQLSSALAKVEFTDEQRQKLLQAKTEAAQNGVYVTPPKDLVLSMSPTARQQVYRFLSQFPENILQREAVILPKDSFEAFFASSGLPSKTISLVKQLSYPHKSVLLFADLPYVLETLNTYDDKLRLEKAISRRSTMLMRLHVTPDSDINGLLNYWGRAGKGKDLKPLLESVAQVPGGVRVNMAILLPPMPSARIYTFPFPSLNQVENCHWASFNFFKDPPEPGYTDMKVLRQKLDAEYHPVFSDPRYGDLVFLLKANGEIVHSAVYLADNVVFTKNGGHFTAPWLLMKIPDLLDAYSAFTPENEGLQVMYYRNKYY